MEQATKPSATASRSWGQALYDNTVGMVPPEITGAVGGLNRNYNDTVGRALRGQEPVTAAPKVPRQTPPARAIEGLKRDPSKAAEFEAKYGLRRGESRRYLIE
jgi:hypothetical protein